MCEIKEVKITYISEVVTKKCDWQTKVFNPCIVSGWKREALLCDSTCGEEFDHIIEMLRAATRGESHSSKCECGGEDWCKACLNTYRGKHDRGFYDWCMNNCTHELCRCISPNFSINRYIKRSHSTSYFELRGNLGILDGLHLDINTMSSGYNVVENLVREFALIAGLWGTVPVILTTDYDKNRRSIDTFAYCVDGECYLDFYKRKTRGNIAFDRYLGVMKCSPGDMIIFNGDVHFKTNSGKSEMLFFVSEHVYG